MTAFEQAFGFLVGHEGKYSNESSDPGNWTGGAVGAGTKKGTAWGISAAAYPTLDIANLTEAQAQAIYKTDYWDKVRGDELPPALALLVFDAAVNNGPDRAIRWLQQAVDVAVDGKFGTGTMGAIEKSAKAAGGAALLSEFMAQRTLFMANLSTWRIYGLGWSRRLCSLPYQAVQMSGG